VRAGSGGGGGERLIALLRFLAPITGGDIKLVEQPRRHGFRRFDRDVGPNLGKVGFGLVGQAESMLGRIGSAEP
jgi:hypothetical protein